MENIQDSNQFSEEGMNQQIHSNLRLCRETAKNSKGDK